MSFFSQTIITDATNSVNKRPAVFQVIVDKYHHLPTFLEIAAHHIQSNHQYLSTFLKTNNVILSIISRNCISFNLSSSDQQTFHEITAKSLLAHSSDFVMTLFGFDVVSNCWRRWSTLSFWCWLSAVLAYSVLS